MNELEQQYIPEGNVECRDDDDDSSGVSYKAKSIAEPELPLIGLIKLGNKVEVSSDDIVGDVGGGQWSILSPCCCCFGC